MNFEEILGVLKNPSFGDLRRGAALNELYWMRDEGVPALLDRIDSLNAQIDGLKEAIAREGAANQERLSG
jgi:hypothetical protein